MLGDFGVGKTCLTKRCVQGTFLEDYKPSIGVDVSSHRVSVDQGEVQLQIWDMSGQHIFRQLRLLYLKGADLAVIVLDVTRRSSLNSLPFWLEEARVAGIPLPIVLVGNKADMKGERAITAQEGETAAKSNRFLFYTETSAKSGNNVAGMFEQVARQLLQRYLSKPTKKGKQDAG
jgi:small GTP-binding protein